SQGLQEGATAFGRGPLQASAVPAEMPALWQGAGDLRWHVRHEEGLHPLVQGPQVDLAPPRVRSNRKTFVTRVPWHDICHGFVHRLKSASPTAPRCEVESPQPVVHKGCGGFSGYDDRCDVRR